MPSNADGDGWLLSAQTMRSLGQHEYQYNAWSDTILDPYMQPFWRLAVTYIPTYITPSTISLVGLCCNIVATCVTVYLAPTMTESLPAWASVLNAISIFLYQTCDGLDGKQCSRTQETEVEEYADHAVDSISVTLNAILLAAAMQLGDSRLLLGANLILAMSAFFAAHWAAQRTNSLVFGHVDVTEAQWGMITIHIATAVGGSGVWDRVIFNGLSVTVKDAVSVICAATLLFGTLENMSYAVGSRQSPLERHGIFIPRSPRSFWPFATYGIILAGSLPCVASGLLTSLTVPTILIVGLPLGKAGTQLILQKVARETGPILDLASFAPLALFIVQTYQGDRTRFVESVAWALVSILVVDVAWLHARALLDLGRARGCDIFSVGNRPEEARLKSSGFYVAHGNLQDIQSDWKHWLAKKAQQNDT